VSRFSSPPQKSEAAAAAGRVLLQTAGNSQFGAPLLTGASSQEKSRWDARSLAWLGFLLLTQLYQ
jgi:hypothetical protein